MAWSYKISEIYSRSQLSNFILSFIVYIFLFFPAIDKLSAQDIQINEFCSSNVSILADENGDFPDWIEIYNPGPSAINLAGYGLSDDINLPLKWLFPQYSLQANNYLVVFASGKNSNFIPGFWNGIITEGDSWKYIVPQSEPPSTWVKGYFDDSGWLTGPSGFGYGDGDDNTIIDPPSPYISIYMRKTFTIDDPTKIEELIFSMDYDDGFVAYLNGTEIARENIIGQPPAFNIPATDYVEPIMIYGGKPNNYDLKSSLPLLKAGQNTLAIQVHNQSDGSSDITAIPFLSFKSSAKLYDDPIPVLGLNSNSFHTNFKLDKTGDSIYLSLPNGDIKQFVQFGYTQSDISYGYPLETGSEIKAFTEPTPWQSNASQPYNYKLFDDILFSKKSGIYTSGIEVKLSTSSGNDKIYYTMDGSDPDENSLVYSNPIRITETNTIKARLIIPEYLPGEVFHRTYSTRISNGLPTLFISTNPPNFWDNETGIYVLGSNAEPNSPRYGANFWEDWEKPVHLEYFDQNGDSAFSINAGVKIFGAWSREREMKSLAFFARSEYGDKNIPYKLFDDKDLDKFEAFVIRNSGNDWYGSSSGGGSMMRDIIMTRTAGKSGIDVQAGRPISVVLNGDYWGLYNLREKVNEHYISSNHSDIDPDRINLLVNDKQVIQGSNADYLAMEGFVRSNSLSVNSNYEYIKTKIDIDNYIDYNVAQIYYGNTDWPGNNTKFWKFDTEYSKWRWILYDTDFGLGIYGNSSHNTLTFAVDPNGPGWPNPPWATFLLRSFMENQEFRNVFANTMADRINTVFNPSYLNPEIDKLQQQYQEEMKQHVLRWGGNIDSWGYNIQNIKNYVSSRPVIMRNYVRNYFGISTERTVTIRVKGCPKPSIKLNTVILDSFPWSGIYWDQIPVKLRAISPKGYRFLRWEGTVNSTEQEIILDMKSSASLQAVYEPYSEEEFEGVIINEISYNNPTGKDWVEIYNNSKETKDVSGWILKDSDPTHSFKISSNTLLLPEEFLVIVEEEEAYYNTYLNLSKVKGNSNFGFSIIGECIKLYNSESTIIDSVCFASEYPWPSSPLSTGFPIALSRPNTDNGLGFNWNTASQLEGTPGEPNSVYIGIDPIKEPVNSGLTLYQNFPNPFDNETRIAFHLNEGDYIEIEIYNLNGILISQINKEYYSAGIHEIVWESKNISSGIYILKVSDSRSIQQKRLFINK